MGSDEYDCIKSSSSDNNINEKIEKKEEKNKFET